MFEKEVEHYMSQPYRLEIYPDEAEGGFAAAYPELPGCVTFADTLEEVVKLAVDAKIEWLYAALEDGYSVQDAEGYDKYSQRISLEIPKDLKKSLAKRAWQKGISLEAYCLELLSQNKD